jgi:CHAD domain-containing protein
VRKPGVDLRAAEVLPELIRPLYRSVIKAGRRTEKSPVAEQYHRLRLRCKRLRYVLEFSSSVGGKGLKPYRRRLKKLQDLLGDYNDSVVAQANLEDWISDLKNPLPRPTIFFLGRLGERLRLTGEGRLAEFPDSFRQFKKRRWRALRRVFG